MLLTGGTGADFGYTAASLNESAQTLLSNAADLDDILEGAKEILRTKMIENSVSGNIVTLVTEKFQKEVVEPATRLTEANAEYGQVYKTTADLATDLDAENKAILG